MPYDLSEIRNAAGRASPQGIEVATAAPVAKMAATLGVPIPASAAGDALPPGWHGLYFGAQHRPDNMRADGQAIASSWMPAIPLPYHRIRRDRQEFPGEIRLGDELKRRSIVAEVSETGKAALRVVLRNEITGPRGLAVVEERESLYFEGKLPAAEPAPELPKPVWKKTIEPSPVLMFRFSALRFNSHRIHYDRDYAMKEEKLPGLVVQASLLAQLSLDLCRTSCPGRRIASFAGLNRHPAYDTGPVTICGAPTDAGAMMWSLDASGSVAQYGEIRFAEG
jgi:3-methylfumaryl-CoA hydratase